MNKRLIRVLSVLLVLVLMLTACAEKPAASGDAGKTDTAKTETSKSEPAKTDTAKTEPAKADATGTEGEGPAFYDVPFADGKTISIGTNENLLAGYPYADGLPVWQNLEKSTGMKIEWDTVPSAEYNTVMQTRLAAGTDLPDFINVSSNVMKHVNDGTIICLDEYMEKWGYYTDYFLYTQGNDYMLPYMKAPDGKMYFWSSDVAGTNAADPYGWIYREDLLAKTSVKELKTMDDWYTAATEMYQQDNNIIPFMWDSPWQQVGLAWNLHLFGSQGGWAVDKDGKVVYDYTDERLVEVLEYLQKAYKENLLDKEFLDLNDEKRLTRVSNGQGFSYFGFINKLSTFNKAIDAAGIEGPYVMADAPVADDSYKPGVPMYGPSSGKYGFTIDALDENFEYKFKFIDYVYGSDEGALTVSMGVEGKSFEYKDGIPVLTEYVTNNPDGLGVNAALRALGAMPTMPWTRSLYGMSRYQCMGTIANNPIALDAAERTQAWIYTGFPTGLLLTEEQDVELAKYLPDIETAVKEFCAKAITTDMDIAAEFDQFVSDINAFGLDKCIVVRQAQYEASGMDLYALAANY